MKLARVGIATALSSLPSAVHAEGPMSYLQGHGASSDSVAQLTWGLLGVSIAVVVIVSLLLAAGLWRHRNAPEMKPGDNLPVERSRGGLSWIHVGTGISTVVLLACTVWTMVVLAATNAPPSVPALTVEVTAHQWWWQVRYLNADPSRIFTTANEIHIPTGEPVRFRLVSRDVIHSFWVPALGGKTDLIPGRTNTTWLEADKPGIYKGQCAEYCGTEHALMKLTIVAQPRKDFEAWWTHQLADAAAPADDGAGAAGETAFLMRCSGCHAIRGTEAAGILGPDLSHLMTRRTLAAGVLPNTIGNLSGWIADPQTVKPGSMMPRVGLSGRELADIRTYLETLN